MRPPRRNWLAVFAVCTIASGMPLRAAAPKGVYELGYQNVRSINADLVLALEPSKRRQVSSNTVLLGTVRLPCVAGSPGVNPDAPGQPVRISASFVDFINRVAHAKAVDETERGFFQRYTTQLADDPHTLLA